MAEQEGLQLEEEHPIITDEELLCYKPNTQVLLLAADHKKNKTGKPFLVLCNNDLQVGDQPKPVTIYNRVWHSYRPSGKGHNLLGTEWLSIHNYNISPEGTPVQMKEKQINTPENTKLGHMDALTNPKPT
jgi:hypothetical protein